jgi:uncharacterized coiled-coil protein SlyX
MTPRLSFVVVLSIALLTLTSLTQAQQPSVRADRGSVAVGGDVSAPINIGIPPEQLAAVIQQGHDLSESQKKLIAELEGKLDLNQRQVRAALDILGEKDIPPERLAAKLVEIAERFKALQADALAHPGDDAKVAALKAEAQKAIQAGDLAKADALLADVESEQRRMLSEQRSMLDRLAVNAAEPLGGAGISPSLACNIAKQLTTSRMPRRRFLRKAPTTRSESAISQARLALFAGRETNSATMTPCAQQSNGGSA